MGDAVRSAGSRKAISRTPSAEKRAHAILSCRGWCARYMNASAVGVAERRYKIAKVGSGGIPQMMPPNRSSFNNCMCTVTCAVIEISRSLFGELRCLKDGTPP